MEKTKKCGTRIFHRGTSTVRQVFVNRFGDVIVLTGIYAFEWTVMIENKSGITEFVYPNRIAALRAFRERIRL